MRDMNNVVYGNVSYQSSWGIVYNIIINITTIIMIIICSSVVTIVIIIIIVIFRIVSIVVICSACPDSFFRSCFVLFSFRT